MLELKIKLLDKNMKLPAYAKAGDAGFDLCARETVTLKVGERASIATGIAMEIPEGYVGLIWDKSGLSQNYGLKSLGGVVDAGYRGEVKVGIINLGRESYTFERGHKVAQMIIQKREEVSIVEAKELSDTSRGKGGFGSTGK